jgi:hypothetical protein
MGECTSDVGPTVAAILGKNGKWKIITYLSEPEELRYGGRGEASS